MPSIYDVKKQFQNLLRPVVDGLHKTGIRPNHLTLLALSASILAGTAPFFAVNDVRWLLVLPPWLFLRMALNAMDGMLAREHNLATPLGGILNEVGDVMADLALYLPLAFFRPEAALPIAAFNFAAMLTEFCGLLGPALGVSRRYNGPMGKSDRAFLVGLVCLLALFVPATLRYWPWIFYAAAALAVLTCLNRLRGALREVKGKAAA